MLVVGTAIIVNLGITASVLECSAAAANYILLTSYVMNLRIMLELLLVSILIKLHVLVQNWRKAVIVSSRLELVAKLIAIRWSIATDIICLTSTEGIDLLFKIDIIASDKPS